MQQKSFGVGQPRRIENAKILIANTPMDTDKIKIYGSRVRTVLETPDKSFVSGQLLCNLFTAINVIIY